MVSVFTGQGLQRNSSGAFGTKGLYLPDFSRGGEGSCKRTAQLPRGFAAQRLVHATEACQQARAAKRLVSGTFLLEDRMCVCPSLRALMGSYTAQQREAN